MVFSRWLCTLMAWGAALTPSLPAGAMVCAADRVPAATVLVPYVEADVASCASASLHTTRVALLNPTPTPMLAHVTLWSDMAVPVLNFDIYLAGHVTEAFDLRQVLCTGDLPTTGSAVSPVGTLADPPAAFPLCNDTTNPANGPPVYAPGAVSPTLRSDLRAVLTGQVSPTSGLCAGFDHGDSIARGYVTVDAVTSCSLMFPDEPGYDLLLADTNGLVADAVLTDAAGTETGLDTVAIESDPSVLGGPGTTFYGRYNTNTGADAREPLPTAFASAYAPNDRFVVWRETSAAANPFPCGSPPAWYPLDAVNSTGAGPLLVVAADGSLATLPSTAFPLATQLVAVGSAGLPISVEGKLYANLQSNATSRPSPAGQAWVQLLAGTGSSADAGALDSSCSVGSFNWTSPGPTLSP